MADNNTNRVARPRKRGKKKPFETRDTKRFSDTPRERKPRSLTLQIQHAVHLSRLPPELKHLLLTYAFWAHNDTGVGWTGQARMAAYLGIKPRALRDRLSAINDHADSPVRVDRSAKYGGVHGRTSDTYTLVLIPAIVERDRAAWDAAFPRKGKAAKPTPCECWKIDDYTGEGEGYVGTGACSHARMAGHDAWVFEGTLRYGRHTLPVTARVAAECGPDLEKYCTECYPDVAIKRQPTAARDGNSSGSPQHQNAGSSGSPQHETAPLAAAHCLVSSQVHDVGVNQEKEPLFRAAPESPPEVASEETSKGPPSPPPEPQPSPLTLPPNWCPPHDADAAKVEDFRAAFAPGALELVEDPDDHAPVVVDWPATFKKWTPDWQRVVITAGTGFALREVRPTAAA